MEKLLSRYQDKPKKKKKRRSQAQFVDESGDVATQEPASKRRRQTERPKSAAEKASSAAAALMSAELRKSVNPLLQSSASALTGQLDEGEELAPAVVSEAQLAAIAQAPPQQSVASTVSSVQSDKESAKRRRRMFDIDKFDLFREDTALDDQLKLRDEFGDPMRAAQHEKVSFWLPLSFY
ncbi:MAG: hypothetical protein MHM6MM_007861, partial [Cercozoa sp. M6MM]